jgi:outer membrane receptor protein involved in Fe transport
MNAIAPAILSQVLKPVFFCLMLVAYSFAHAQEGRKKDAAAAQSGRGLEESVNVIRDYYDEERFEDAYDQFIVLYHTYYYNVNEGDRMLILDWGIRLSFITEHFLDLDRYISEYYSLDPYFSVSSLKESSPQLQIYIGNFVRAKSERFVYVNKRKQNIDVLPASIKVYTREDIDRLGARNLLDLARLTAGFAELGDNNERVIGTRGTSSTSLQDILILVDGHRISDVFTNSNGPDWISLDYVEQVEFMRGPGSALYGENAFSGVINIVTQTGRLKNVNRMKVELGNGNSLRDIGSPYNSYHLNYQYGRKVSNNEGFYFSGTFYTSGGAEIDLSQTKVNSVLPDVMVLDSVDSSGAMMFDTLRMGNMNSYEYINRYSPGYNLFFNYHRRALKVTTNAQSSSFVQPRPTSLNTWAFDGVNDRRMRVRNDRREFVHMEYGLLDNANGIPHDLRFKVGGDHFFKDIYFPSRSVGLSGNQRVLGDEYRGTMSLEFSTDSLMNDFSFLGDQHVLIGVEGYFNHWLYNYFLSNDSTFVLSETNDFFSADDESRFEYVAASYLQIDQHIVQDRLIATAGVRFNYHSKYSTFDEFIWGKQYSPRFTLIYLSRKDENEQHPLKIKVLYNSAFFPPPFLYRRGGIFGFRGSDSLSVQRIESGEIVISGDLPHQFSYSAMVYANKIEDVIERVYLPALEQDVYINSPRAQRNVGVEVELEHHYEFGRYSWSSFMNYSLTTRHDFINENKYNYFDLFVSSNFVDGQTLTNYPFRKLVLGSDLTISDVFSAAEGQGEYSPQFSFGFDLQYIGAFEVLSTYILNDQNEIVHAGNANLTSRTLPSAVVLNSRLRMHLKRTSVGLFIYNLANANYYLPNVSYATRMQFAEGRMLLLNLSYLFNAN